MKTKITARFVIGYTGSDHVVFKNGEVVYEGDTILFVGHGCDRPADRTIDAGDAIVAPGFIDLDALGDIDHALLDFGVPPDGWNGLEWSEEYFRTGRREWFSREEEALKRRYALVHLIRNGITTAMPVAGEFQKEWAETHDEFADITAIAADLGLRLYLGPSYRSGVAITRADGSADVAWNLEKGEEGLDAAAAFVKRFDGAHGGMLRGCLAPCRVQTCTPELLRRTIEIARDLDCRVRLHACQEAGEVRLLNQWHGKTTLTYLDEIGFLTERTLIPHGIFVGGRHPAVVSGRDEVELLRSTGASIVHCPLAEARYGVALRSFEQYSRAGVTIALGTDMFPPDMIRTMDYGCYVGRIIDADPNTNRPADLFRAATLGGAQALGRDDLGRLAPGAKADIVIIDASSFDCGVIDDPIRTMVFNLTGRDVRTVIINGMTVMDDRKIPGVDLDDLKRRGQAYFDGFRDSFTERDYQHRRPGELFPPSFPILEPGEER